ncbi:NAD(P)H-dependent oxidoreductase [Sphingomonas oryzagri]
MTEQAPSPVRHVVIRAHPSPKSFNASIAAAYCDTVRACGQNASVRDLYALNFDPLLKEDERPHAGGTSLSSDVREEIAAIRDADIYVLVYPVWFAMPPAIMKGYIDRVFGAEVTVRQIQDRAADGVLSGHHMLSITTSGAREVWLDEQGQVESLRNLSTRYLRNAFGMASCEHLHFGGITEGLSKRFADQYLYDVEERARHMCAMLAAERRTGPAPLSIGDGS